MRGRNAVRMLMLLVGLFFAPAAFTAEENEPGNAETIRVICWRNTEVGAFCWFAFKDDYTPLLFFAQSPDGKTSTSDWIAKDRQIPMHIKIELSPLGITGEVAHHGYSISITHEGKKVKPQDIKTVFADVGGGSFVASLVAANMDVIPKTITDARAMTSHELRKRIEEHQYQCELFQTVPAGPKAEQPTP